jgi:lactoylglutathione lyase
MIKGLYETHLYVADIERSARFYEEVMGLKPVHAIPTARFYWLGEPKQHMLGIWQVPAEKVRRLHIAFPVTPEEFLGVRAWLKERGLAVRNHPETGDDPYVFAWMPAVSLYWSDPDGHSLEFIAILPDEPRPELGVVPWEEWEVMHGRPRPVMK